MTHERHGWACRYHLGMTRLRDEILEQPEVAARFLAGAPGVMGPLVERLRAREIEHVVIAARGTSDHAAIYAQYVLGIRHALSVGLGTPSVISLYGAHPRLDRSLVIGISPVGRLAGRRRGRRRRSSSGRADRGHHQRPDLRAGRCRRDDHRPGGRSGTGDRRDQDVHDRAAGGRRAVGRVVRRRADAAALAALPDTIASVLALEPEVIAMAADQAAATRLLILARGYEYATAREWSLKIKELAHVFADPYSAADFEHGPLALLEPGVPTLAIVRPGPARDGLVALLDRLHRDLDADLGIASDDAAALALARWPLRLPSGTPEWLGPIVSIVVGQLHALHLTRARGLDPEAPRNLNKVTRTH